MNSFVLHNGSGNFCCKSCSEADDKQLNTYDWLADVPGNDKECDLIEVQFKNTRKEYYRNSNQIQLVKGDVVAVEATPGHDIGTVTLTGRLVPLQMRKCNYKTPVSELKRIYRKARPVDMDKYEEAKSHEHATMIKSRQIALNLGLQMKIGDVEYQGDGNKAIFYYIADERVDFRQLIKVLAEVFRVRIEMKQIGARQEAGRIGGIGPCGRELCCATWMKSFVSVSTNAARFQDISLNPQKLAGQCAKLKCCLNYEVDCYVEAQRRLPSKEIELLTKDSTYYFFKADILANTIDYSTDKNIPANIVTISGRRAFEVYEMNKRGEKPDSLLESEHTNAPARPADLLEQESLTRFDHRKNDARRRKGKPHGNGGQRNDGNGQHADAQHGDNRGDGARQDRGPRRNDNRGGNDNHGGNENRNGNDNRGGGANARPDNRNRHNGGNRHGGNNEGRRPQGQQGQTNAAGQQGQPQGPRPQQSSQPQQNSQPQQHGDDTASSK